jgi:replicative DNA helicase
VRRISDLLSEPAQAHCDALTTGFDRLDQLTAGFQAEQVWLITGTPGQGRSTLMTQWAGQLAVTQGWPTWLLAPRESEAATVARLLASLGKLPLNHLQAGRYEARLLAARDRLRRAQMWVRTGAHVVVPQLVGAPSPRAIAFDDGDLIAGLTPATVRELAGGGACVLVSLPRHLLVEGPGQWDDLEPAWARVADAIVEVRSNGLPDERLGEAELSLLKNRRGPLTVAHVAFQGHYARFVEIHEEPGN